MKFLDLIFLFLAVVATVKVKQDSAPFAELQSQLSTVHSNTQEEAESLMQASGGQKKGMGMNLLTRFLAEVITSTNKGRRWNKEEWWNL